MIGETKGAKTPARTPKGGDQKFSVSIHTHLRWICFCLFVLWAVLLYACQPRNPIVGRWCTDPPSSLLYEYRADGSVHLFLDTGEYHVFRYQFPDAHTLRLYDGMGRRLDYRYEMERAGVTLYDPTNPAAPVDHLTLPLENGSCQ